MILTSNGTSKITQTMHNVVSWKFLQNDHRDFALSLIPSKWATGSNGPLPLYGKKHLHAVSGKVHLPFQWRQPRVVRYQISMFKACASMISQNSSALRQLNGDLSKGNLYKLAVSFRESNCHKQWHLKVKQGSLYYQPKQCTIIGEIPQNYHTFALLDPSKMGNLMTPVKSLLPKICCLVEFLKNGSLDLMIFAAFFYFVGFLRGGWNQGGGGNWGTLRIPRVDWGTLGNIRED